MMTVEEMVKKGTFKMIANYETKNELDLEFEGRLGQDIGELEDDLRKYTYNIRVDSEKNVFISGAVFGEEEIQILNNISFLWALAVHAKAIEAIFEGVGNKICFCNPDVELPQFIGKWKETELDPNAIE